MESLADSAVGNDNSYVHRYFVSLRRLCGWAIEKEKDIARKISPKKGIAEVGVKGGKGNRTGLPLRTTRPTNQRRFRHAQARTRNSRQHKI